MRLKTLKGTGLGMVLWEIVAQKASDTAQLSSPDRGSCGKGDFLWLNNALQFFLEPKMGNKIVTEADRKFTPPLPVLPGVTLPTHGRGQRVSLERGVATRSKKNPGKRSKKGG